jgi:hypothetical protein
MTMDYRARAAEAVRIVREKREADEKRIAAVMLVLYGAWAIVIAVGLVLGW